MILTVQFFILLNGLFGSQVCGRHRWKGFLSLASGKLKGILVWDPPKEI